MIIGPDFPIRCGLVDRNGFGKPCNAPAVAALITRGDCECPPGRCPICAACLAKWPVGRMIRDARHKVCDTYGRTFTVIGHDQLNEGDLPDENEEQGA